MSNPGGWHSIDRIDRIFQRSRLVAVIFAAAAAISFLMGWTVPGGLTSLVATTAATIMIFTWFRRDDLARSTNRARDDRR